jgi:hypothetical protein
MLLVELSRKEGFRGYQKLHFFVFVLQKKSATEIKISQENGT